MEQSGKGKAALLALWELLRQETDEEHPLSAPELCVLLAQNGVSVERKAVLRDIAALNEFGMEVIHTHVPKNGFFLGKRQFERPEVRLLMDAVLSAPFLTNRKTDDLCIKLCSLLSRHQAKTVRGLATRERRKFDNEEIYYAIDAIHTAIETGRKIRFCYHHRVIVQNRVQWDEGREFLISPYALMWVDDKYYLAGNYEKYDSVSSYRIDRIRSARVTEIPARPFSQVSAYRDTFDTADYLKKSFHMYTGSQEELRLRCDDSLLETMYDRFGPEMQILYHGNGCFILRALVYRSEGLLEWLLQFGGKAEVLATPALREQMEQKIKELQNAYRRPGEKEAHTPCVPRR